MLVKSMFVIFALFWTTTMACDPNQTCKVDLDDQNIKDLITSIDSFTNSLMYRMYSYSNPIMPTITGNVIISPLSVYTALALILFGAIGETQSELIAALAFPQTELQQLATGLGDILNALKIVRTEIVDFEEVTFEEVIIGQGLFLQKEFILLPEYADLLVKLGAYAENVDYANDPQGVTNIINNWIAVQTGNGETFSMTTSVDESTEILLASTIYFRGKWDGNLFDESQTTAGTFHGINGQMEVPMMKTLKQLLYYDNPQFSLSAVQLPYEGGDYTMLVVRPYADVNLQEFVNTFTVAHYKEITANSQEAAVDCQIPKFVYVWTGTISNHLKEMTINQMFENADLGNMIQNPNGEIRVSEVMHAAPISVDEIGTIATGLRTLEVSSSSPSQNVKTFVVDGPFFIFIRHVQTDIIVLSSYMRQV